MALLKSKTLPNGTSGNYWKITHMSCDKMEMTMYVNISLFKDSTFHMSEDLGVTKNFKFSCTKQQLSSDLTALAYSLIKAKANSNNQFGRVSDADLAGAADA